MTAMSDSGSSTGVSKGSTNASTTQVAMNVSPVFDLPSMIDKNVDQIKKILGVPETDSEPTKQQISAGIDEWSKKWTKDGENLLVTYNVKTREILDFFIDTRDPSGVTSDKNYLLNVGNAKLGEAAYNVEFVEAFASPGKFTGIKIIPVDLKQRTALINQRKTFDTKHGNNAFAANQALELAKSGNSNGIGMDVYIETEVPTDAQNDYLQGGKEATYREKTTIARMTVAISGTAWALSPDSSKKDLVASFVNRLKQIYPNAVPRVTVTNGVRTVAEGSWSIWSEEAKVELK